MPTHGKPSSPDPRNFDTVGDLAERLLEAHRKGRPIIPIVGAGISADSGFPVIVSIVRYFGKLRQLIDKRFWLLGDEVSHLNPLDAIQREYAAEPWKYVRDFGWPDRFQVNEDLWTALDDGRYPAHPPGGRVNMSQAVNDGLVEMLRHSSHSWRMTIFRRLADELEDLLVRNGKRIESSRIDKLRHLVRRRLDHDENERSVPWDLFGDWKRMILDFTRFQSDYADALLARFARDHEPNLAHRYLAFLIHRFNVPVIFTMNFDPFIEEVLQEENLRPRTFAMEHGLTLPHFSLVREQLAVIKMHGSTHALLLDEQLDRPLSHDYLERFERIVGPDPLLLVLGCSGEDNRLLDLVHQALSRYGGRPDSTSVAWVHYEPEPPENVRRLVSESNKHLRFRHTKHLGGTLMHLYSEIDQLHPASRTLYLTHFQQPIVLDRDERRIDSARPTRDAWMKENSARLLKQVFVPGETIFILLESITEPQHAHPRTDDPAVPTRSLTYADPSASRQLLWLGSSLPPGFNLIWVDLEAVHTLSAVAGSIIDQCRKYDSSLTPCVLPHGQANLVHAALAQVEFALRRSRYFVAFDGLETYTWSPTAHHGDTHSTTRAESHQNLEELLEFLEQLAQSDRLSESGFAVSVDQPRLRTLRKSQAVDLLLKKVMQLKLLPRVIDWNVLAQKEAPLEVKRRYPAYANTFEEIPPGSLQGLSQWPGEVKPRWALALSVLATFRRTRPLALVHQVLRPILGGGRPLEVFLTDCQALDVVRQLEGGGIWFHRELRDHIYGRNTGETGAEQMESYLRAVKPVDCQTAVSQLLLNTATHQLVARAWYAGAFIQSHDTYSLLEYFYHRLASVRILTKLIGLIEHAEEDLPARYPSIQAGVAEFERVLKCANDEAMLSEAFEIHREKFFVLPEHWEADKLTAFRKLLVWRHHEELDRLLRVWRKSESVLRAQVPAEQLLRWCEQFLGDDLKDRCHKVVKGYDEAKKCSRCHPVGCLQYTVTEEKGPVRVLREYLEDFQVKILMDRSDYVRCIQARDKPIPDENGVERPLVEHVVKFWLDKPEERFDKPSEQKVRWARHWMDVIGSQLRQAQEVTDKVKTLREAADECAEKFRKWNGLVEPEWDTEPSGLRELQLRGLHFLSNCYLRRVCVFSHDGFNGNPALDMTEDSGGVPAGFDGLEQARSIIDCGTMVARLQSQPQTPTPQSATINAVVDGTLYLPYRGTFMMQHARWRWMDAVRKYYAVVHPTSDDTKVMVGGAGVSSLSRSQERKTSRELLNAMDEALCEFEKSRAGLSGTNDLTLALIDLHTVEACLAHARIILHEKTAVPADLNDVDCFELARSRYETSRGLLARARASLMRAQRNVIWWRLFFQLTTQYHADRLLLGVSNLFRQTARVAEFRADPARAKLAGYLLRLRKGYASLKSAHDLYLREPGDTLVWLPRLRRELTLGGFVLGLVAWHLHSGAFFADEVDNLIDPAGPTVDRLREDKVISFLCEQLHWLERTAGIKQNSGVHLRGERTFAGMFQAVQQAVAEVYRLGRAQENDRISIEAANIRGRRLRDLIVQTANRGGEKTFV